MKDQPRQRPIGTCGHEIKRVKRERTLLWYCPESCGYETKYSHLKLQSRGKAK